MKFNVLILSLVIASLLVGIIQIQISVLRPEPTHSVQLLSSRGAISNPTEITYPIHRQTEKKMPDNDSRPHLISPIDDIDPSGSNGHRYFGGNDDPCSEQNILRSISQDQPCGHAWGG